MNEQRIQAALLGVTLHEEQKSALRARILAAAEETRAAVSAEPRRTGLKWLIPVAAAVAVLIAVLSVPSVSRAVSDWLGRLFRIEQYLGTLPEDRTPEPAVDAAIQTPGVSEQTGRVLLLDETDEYEIVAAMRKEYGRDPFRPEDWAWLKQAQPEIREVLYDDGCLYVTAFLRTDPLPFYRDTGDVRADWIAEDASVRLMGTETDIPLIMSSTGIYSQPPYYDENELNEQALLSDGGVYLVSQYATEMPLAPGQYLLTQRSRILDTNADVMAYFATVATVEQTTVVQLGTENAAPIKGGEVALSGTYTLTVE